MSVKTNIFSSFIYEELFNLDVKSMKDKILKIKSNGLGRDICNYGGWQSHNFKKIDKSFKNLFDKINSIIPQATEQLELTNPIKLQSYWILINKPGSFYGPHNHAEAIISGVYYIDAPEHCGRLVFDNWIDAGGIYKKTNKFNEYNSSNWRHSPQNNLCLLFPSYLKHYVEPNFNKKNRISVSFNYGF